MSSRWQEWGTAIRQHIPDGVLRAWRAGKSWMPLVVSITLITWLIWKITPQALLAALEELDWPWVVGISVAQVVGLFTWDTFCLWWLFKQPHRHVPFWALFRARTDSILWSAVNLEIGQAVFAYRLAKVLGKSVSEALGRCVVLALFDFGTLQTLALVGSFFLLTPLTQHLRWIPIGAVSGLFVLACLIYFLPRNWRDWLKTKDWWTWLEWWTWRHSITLFGLRLVMFALVLVYAGVGLALVGVHMTPRRTLGVIPYVLVAESLPATGGLGEREAALVYLISPDPSRRAAVFSFGLIWSLSTILGRVLIGLTSGVLPRMKDDPSRDASPTEPAAAAG